jgi:hypothetical protein
MIEISSRKATGEIERAAAPCREKGILGEVHHKLVVAEPAVRRPRPGG